MWSQVFEGFFPNGENSIFLEEQRHKTRVLKPKINKKTRSAFDYGPHVKGVCGKNLFVRIKAEKRRVPATRLRVEALDWWGLAGSNRRPPACEAGTLTS